MAEAQTETGEIGEIMLLSDVNALGFEDFINVFDNVIELCPIVAATIWTERPFRDLQHVQQSIDTLVDALPLVARAGMLRCLPDLAGRMAAAGQLSHESKLEQKAAGLDEMTVAEKEHLQKYNDRYKQKFGFPFVICARQNKKEAIMKGIVQRLNNDRIVEINTGVNEVKKICWLRLSNIVKTSDGAKL